MPSPDPVTLEIVYDKRGASDRLYINIRRSAVEAGQLPEEANKPRADLPSARGINEPQATTADDDACDKMPKLLFTDKKKKRVVKEKEEEIKSTACVVRRCVNLFKRFKVPRKKAEETFLNPEEFYQRMTNMTKNLLPIKMLRLQDIIQALVEASLNVACRLLLGRFVATGGDVRYGYYVRRTGNPERDVQQQEGAGVLLKCANEGGLQQQEGAGVLLKCANEGGPQQQEGVGVLLKCANEGGPQQQEGAGVLLKCANEGGPQQQEGAGVLLKCANEGVLQQQEGAGVLLKCANKGGLQLLPGTDKNYLRRQAAIRP
ncbi:hypothetical protein C0Q70_18567 [Pomacea canaliculata]|uniref:Uncharacterized protein n=1 Tax=Pomacea canaliculata TaxID=400727 RepID=A0A2T7NGV6_POMCA|nr:hypothetical protein C0Q70_18567 [Pomacea canaliculata]